VHEPPAKVILPAAAPAPDPEPREDSAFVRVEIDHAVVAVDVHGNGAENNEEHACEGAREHNWNIPAQ
jgi:hypothetical protein